MMRRTRPYSPVLVVYIAVRDHNRKMILQIDLWIQYFKITGFCCEVGLYFKNNIFGAHWSYTRGISLKITVMLWYGMHRSGHLLSLFLYVFFTEYGCLSAVCYDVLV